MGTRSVGGWPVDVLPRLEPLSTRVLRRFLSENEQGSDRRPSPRTGPYCDRRPCRQVSLTDGVDVGPCDCPRSLRVAGRRAGSRLETAHCQRVAVMVPSLRRRIVPRSAWPARDVPFAWWIRIGHRVCGRWVVAFPLLMSWRGGTGRRRRRGHRTVGLRGWLRPFAGGVLLVVFRRDTPTGFG